MITIRNVKKMERRSRKVGFLVALTALHCFWNINIQCSCIGEPRWPATPEFPERAWTHPRVHTHKFTQMWVRSAELFLDLAVNHSDAACPYKSWIHTPVHSDSTAQAGRRSCFSLRVKATTEASKVRITLLLLLYSSGIPTSSFLKTCCLKRN